MPTPTRAAAGDDLILYALVAGWATLQALATIAVALAALLLTATRWRPAAAPELCRAPLPEAVAQLPPEPPAASPVAPLEALTVQQLRRRARSAGLPQLARSGRRGDLLAALALAP